MSKNLFGNIHKHNIIISYWPEWRVTGGANKGILVTPGLDWDGWSSGHQGREGFGRSPSHVFRSLSLKTRILWKRNCND